MVIWLIGLSGAGKTTIGEKLYKRVNLFNSNTVYLDGDILRDVWGDNLGHDIESRSINAHRLSHLSSMLDKQGVNVIAAVLSIFPEWQTWNRNNIQDYFEIFLDVPFDIVKKRDAKGIYQKAERGEINNVVGVDIPFTSPRSPDLTLSPPEVLEHPDEVLNSILSDSRLEKLFLQ